MKFIDAYKQFIKQSRKQEREIILGGIGEVVAGIENEFNVIRDMALEEEDDGLNLLYSLVIEYHSLPSPIQVRTTNYKFEDPRSLSEIILTSYYTQRTTKSSISEIIKFWEKDMYLKMDIYSASTNVPISLSDFLYSKDPKIKLMVDKMKKLSERIRVHFPHLLVTTNNPINPLTFYLVWNNKSPKNANY